LIGAIYSSVISRSIPVLLKSANLFYIIYRDDEAVSAKLFQKTAILGSYTTNADHKFFTSVTIWAAILVPESAAPPKFFEIIVKTAAPRQIRTFVLIQRFCR